jgi:hypothetical protein
MPRKQRFKPSRKPKPMPSAQTPESTQREPSSMQPNDATRVPDEDRPTTVVDGHVPGHQEHQDRIELR